MFLFNGQIISSKKNADNEIISFEQLNIDLSQLTTTTIKEPKIQETSTLKLLNCLSKSFDKKFCSEGFKKEILPTLNRRIITPLYIPVLSLICAFLLVKSRKRFMNKVAIFIYGFLLLLFTELAVRYTGINKIVLVSFMLIPISLFLIIYPFLFLKFSKESKLR